MKPLLLILRVATSFKTETKIILISLAVLLLLPVFAVVVVAESGLKIVSDALAIFNPITHKVEVRDPDGGILVELDATTVWPAQGHVSLEFGERSEYQKFHTGIDIANREGKIGDPITVFMAGKVTKAGSLSTACGQCVYVDHGNNIESHYSHLSEINVKPGQEVKPGDIIGLMGEEGWATGPHLHFEIRVYDIPVNPRVFMMGEPEL